MGRREQVTAVALFVRLRVGQDTGGGGGLVALRTSTLPLVVRENLAHRVLYGASSWLGTAYSRASTEAPVLLPVAYPDAPAHTPGLLANPSDRVALGCVVASVSSQSQETPKVSPSPSKLLARVLNTSGQKSHAEPWLSASGSACGDRESDRRSHPVLPHAIFFHPCKAPCPTSANGPTPTSPFPTPPPKKKDRKCWAQTHTHNLVP
jgi:hypothetical protein